MAIIFKAHKICNTDTVPYVIDARVLSIQNVQDIDAAALPNFVAVQADAIKGFNPYDSEVPLTLETLYNCRTPYILKEKYSTFARFGGQANSGSMNVNVERMKFDDSAKSLARDTDDPTRAAAGSSNGSYMFIVTGNQGSYDKQLYKLDGYTTAESDMGYTMPQLTVTLNGRKGCMDNNGLDFIHGMRQNYDANPNTVDFERFRPTSNVSSVLTWTLSDRRGDGMCASDLVNILFMGGVDGVFGGNDDIYRMTFEDTASAFGVTTTNLLLQNSSAGYATHYDGDVICSTSNRLQRIKMDDSAAVTFNSNASVGFYNTRLAQNGEGDYVRHTGYTIGGGGPVNDEVFKYKFDNSVTESIMTTVGVEAVTIACLGEAI
jgi:hypothetical protein